VLDIPFAIDLAVAVVPARDVLDVAVECGRKGVPALVVISAGFAEVGEEGSVLQRDLVEVCRRFGMRLLGPNCMGVMNTYPAISLNATFAPSFPPAGRVAFSSQSGALGLAVIEHASAFGMGLSSFVSVGNKADISGNDLIHYWETDEATDVILLYLESFGNPRRFARITRRVGKLKPILAVKSGRSSAGARATTSHTGALVAGSDVTVDALFRQAGVIRTDTLAELFDVASLLVNQPPPAGRRVGIVTNAGGPGILCTDACEGRGLEVPPLAESVREQLRAFLPPEASVANPVDMIASASADDYGRTIAAMGAGGAVDAVVVLFVPPLVTRAEDVAGAIRRAAASLPPTLPILTVFMSAQDVPPELSEGGVRIPSYRFPEDAARALARAAEYGMWRNLPEGSERHFDGLRIDEAAAVIAGALGDESPWLAPAEVARLFDCYGLALAEWRVASTPAEAGQRADELDGEVALKAFGPTIVHKTEAGAVRLPLRGGAAVGPAAEEMSHRVQARGHRIDGFLIQRVVPDGIEMLVGVVHDPHFGPVIACGAGGVLAELVKDVAVRITPLTEGDAREMVRSLRTYPLFEGYRGGPKGDVGAVEDVLLRVSSMVENHPEIVEMDCNPLIVLPQGAVIADARVRVEPAAPERPLAARTI
jgi:acyl-CoA synthetase (NDP forming)